MPAVTRGASPPASLFGRVWERLVAPSPRLEGLAARKKARLLAGMLALLITIFAIVDTVFVIVRPGYVPPWYGYLFLFTAYGLSRTRHPTVGAAIMLAMFPIVMLALVLNGDLAEPAGVSFMAVGLVLGPIFLEIRGLIVQTAVHLLVVVLIGGGAAEVGLSEASVAATMGVNALTGGLAVLHVHHRNQIERERQAALRDAEERQRLALDAAAMGTWDYWIDADHVVISDHLARILGCLHEQFGGDLQALLACIHADDRARVRAWIEQAIATKEPEIALEHRVARSDGSVAIVEVRVRVTRDESGRASRVTGAVIDVTERRKLEDHMHKSARLEALGRLAGGIAHDFNNLLMVIRGNAELIQLKQAGEAVELDEILEAVGSGESLIKQLLTTSRQAVIQPRVVDLGEVVRGTSEMIRRLIGKDIEVALELAPDSWPAKVDPHQVQQALLNLATNARDAMPKGGRLTLRTCNQTLAGEGEDHPGDWVVISIADDGAGMDEETRRRAFEPFFTTKGIGEGTGLGLAMVFGMVAQNHGFVRLWSKLGDGTTVDLAFPREL